MKTVSYNGSASSHPVSYDSGYSAYSVSGLDQGNTDSTSTNYATINFTRGTDAETIIFYNFDLNIPSAATITSVTCKAKCYISTTNSSRIATRQIQLYSGSTAMGSAYTVSNSTSEFTMTPGTWTAAQLNNAKIRLYAKRGSSNTTTNYYYRFYGATLSVEYTVNATAYEVTASSNVNGVTIQPATQDVIEGESGSVVVSSITDIVITDNGTDVTSSFITVNGTISAVPESQTNSGLDGGTSYASYAVGYSAENPNSQNGNMYAASGSTGYVDYAFDFSEIPSGATINSVEVKLYGKRENATTDSTHVAKIGLYSGSTLKSTEQQFTSTSMQTITISNPGTWTRTELQSAKVRFTVAYYGGAISGITWNVSYSIQGYQYTLTNVQADHTIIVSAISSEGLYFKAIDNWFKASKIYKKVNNVWTEVQLNTLTDENIYIYKGGVGYNNSNIVMNLDGIDSYASRSEDQTEGYEGRYQYPISSSLVMREIDVDADGQSFTFNGTTSYMRPNASATFDNFLYNTHTIECYFEPQSYGESGSGYTLFVGRNSKQTIAIYCYLYDGKMNFIRSSGTSTKMLSINPPALNQKHYIAANNNGWIFDGVYYPDSESSSSTNSVSTNDILNVSGQYACASIGMRFKNGKDPDCFTGKIYAMRIHNSILTKNQLLQNMMCDIGRFQ